MYRPSPEGQYSIVKLRGDSIRKEGCTEMRYRLMGSILALAAVLALSPVILAQTPAQARGTRSQAMRRTTDGKPDLSGVWTQGGLVGFAPDAGAEAEPRIVTIRCGTLSYLLERYFVSDLPA